MSTVICSCLLGDNARIRLKLSKMLQEEASGLYPDELPDSPVPVCEVEMKGCRREFYADKSGEEIAIGTPVIVEADGGFDLGIVYTTGRIALRKLQLKGMAGQIDKLSPIMRRATEEEVRDFSEIRKREPEIRDACLKRIERHQLEMKLVDIDLRLDQQKLSVYYTATHRVDFRGLVRDLAGEFKARIQMVRAPTPRVPAAARSAARPGCRRFTPTHSLKSPRPSRARTATATPSIPSVSATARSAASAFRGRTARAAVVTATVARTDGPPSARP